MKCSFIELIVLLPSILDVYLGELDSAVSMFNRFKRKPAEFWERKVLINANKLMEIVKEDDLPHPSEIETLPKWKEIVSELNRFEFLSEKSDPDVLLARIVVALYRTYILHKIPVLRKRGAQVASTIEEMLAILALKGFDTHLFQATKHWIKDWKGEGFSKELALKIKNF